MKSFKQFLFAATAAYAAVVVVGCATTNPEQPADPTKSANIPTASMPKTSTGGDIRGNYAINEPFVSVVSDIQGLTITPMTTANSGTGTMKFEGSSASSGTYTQTNLKPNLQGSINLSILGANIPISLSELGDAFAMNVGKTTGTWKVTGNNLSINDGTPLPYTVDSKGLYLISSAPAMGLGSITIILAFKK
jgi:hypothetical protein